MMAFTHVATGLFFGAATSAFAKLDVGPSLLMLSGSIAGSLLPDIDHPKSWLGRRILFLSLPISAIFGHRGITHSFLAVAAVAWGMWYLIAHWQLSAGWSVFAVGIGAGYLSHLLGDWASNSGVPLMWPNTRRFSMTYTLMTGGVFERVVSFVLVLLSSLMMVKLFIQ